MHLYYKSGKGKVGFAKERAWSFRIENIYIIRPTIMV
jgi:hypothetical protein